MGTVTSSTSVAEQPPSRGTEAGGAGRLAQVRWDRWFLALGIPFGLLLMIFLKPNLSPDAPFHFLRIDELSHGHVVSPRDASGQAIASPDACAAGVFTSMFSQWLDNSWHPSDAFRRMPCKARGPIGTSNTALNSPVAYVPAVLGYGAGRLVGSSALGMWLARLAGLSAYLALCWAAIRLSPRGRPVLFLVALLPTSMTLAANLSADPMAISLGLLATALLLRLLLPRRDEATDGPDRTGWLLVGLGVCLFLLAGSKNLYAPVALTAFLVPTERFRSVGRRIAYGAAVLGSVAITAGLWSLLVVDKVRFILFWNGADSIRQKAWIRDHPVGYLRIVGHSLFGTALLLNHTIPGMVAPSWWRFQSRAPGIGESTVSLVVTVGMIAAAFLVGSARRGDAGSAAGAGPASHGEVWLIRGVVAVVWLAVFALVVYGESVASAADLRTHPVINYIEGRYFLPILPLFLLPLAARGRLLAGATSRAWAWVLPVSLVLVTGWTVVRFGQLSF